MDVKKEEKVAEIQNREGIKPPHGTTSGWLPGKSPGSTGLRNPLYPKKPPPPPSRQRELKLSLEISFAEIVPISKTVNFKKE